MGDEHSINSHRGVLQYSLPLLLPITAPYLPLIVQSELPECPTDDSTEVMWAVQRTWRTGRVHRRDRQAVLDWVATSARKFPSKDLPNLAQK